MASNKDLIAEAEALAEGLDIEINTEGLKNADLAALVSDLKAKQRDAENVTQADADADADADAAVFTICTVAAGKSVTSKRGIRGEGVEVYPGDFSGGEDTINSLIERGVLVRS